MNGEQHPDEDIGSTESSEDQKPNLIIYEYTSDLGEICLARLRGERFEDMELPYGIILGEDGELHTSV